MKKLSQLTEQTKTNLINSFWKIYKKEDITKITVKMICDDANYNRTTFYRYFNNVNDILKELEDIIIYNIKEDIKKKTNNKKNIGIIYDNFNNFSNNYGEYIIFFYKKDNNSFFNKFKKFIKNDVFEYLNFNIIDDFKKDFIYEFLFSSLIHLYIYWYDHKNVIDLKLFVKIANNMLSICVDTIMKNI